MQPGLIQPFGEDGSHRTESIDQVGVAYAAIRLCGMSSDY
jgi:hypothetical protein